MTATNNAAYPQLPDKQFFTIGEAATLAGTKSHVVRYWEREISVLTKVSRRRGGRRYYTVEEVLLLRRINDLINNEGYTIAGAGSILSGGGEVAVITKKSLRCELERIIAIL
ncbi:MAG: MerR family transcriptional regulator [Proteobacteria bacterium]|nr:MerR family transcriptional regulator [Pseudomonadota bacterium]MCH9758129.1 MerR family transcriptional regulator [Pseudomonadota bacterium]